MRTSALRKEDVIARATGRWRGILTELGVDATALSGNHGPCPLCGDGKDRFRFDDKDGRGTYFCSVCGPGDGMTFVMKWTGQSFVEALKIVNDKSGGAAYQAPSATPDVKKNREGMQKVLARSRRIQQGDQVWRYLSGRGIHLMPNALSHEALAYWTKDDETGELVKVGHFPAMIGVVQNPAGETIALHRTYLQDGKKAPVREAKKLTPLAGDSKGCAIRLYDMSEDGVLGVAEGIETACATTALFGVPTWSTVSAAMMVDFVPPEGCKVLHIFGDNDQSFTGQSAAFALARKLRHSWDGRVLVSLPPEDGDFADMLPKPRAASSAPQRDAGAGSTR